MGPPQVKLLLDSAILIDHFNGLEAATARDFPPKRFRFVVIPYIV